MTPQPETVAPRLSPEKRKLYEHYAVIFGYDDYEGMSDDRLQVIIDAITDQCESYKSN